MKIIVTQDDINLIVHSHKWWLHPTSVLTYKGENIAWSRALFMDMCLDGADFKGANIAGSVFIRCVFEAADFTGANLKGAQLIDSVFTGADFAEANLDGAKIRNSLTQEDVFITAANRALLLGLYL